MADLQQLQEALRRAHAAGNTEDARRLAAAIDQMRPPLAPDEVVQAFVGDRMSPQEKREFAQDVESGLFRLPPGTRMGEGVFEIPEEPGLVERIGQAITGEDRSTEEIERLPDWMSMPEMARIFSLPAAVAQISTIATTPEESVDVIKEQFPNVTVRQDEKGNFILKSAEDNQEYAIKPGFRVSDIPRVAASMLAFTPAGRATTVPRAAGTAAATQAVIEGTQAAGGGQFDAEQVPFAAATEVAGRGIGRLLTSAKGPIQRSYQRFVGREVPLSAREQAVQEATEAGVDVLTTDVLEPRTFAARLAQATSERIPFIGTGPVREAQAQTRVKAVRQLLRNFGADQTADASDDVMKELLLKRSNDLNKYSTMRNEVIERLSTAGEVPVDETLKVLDDEIATLNALDSPGGRQAARFFEGYKQAFQGKNAQQLDLLRREMGDMLSSDDLANIKSTAEKSARKIYRAIQDDTGKFIQNVGERRDFTKWNVGTKKLAAMMGDLESTTLKSVLRKGDIEPEKVKSLLFSQKPSQIRLLYKNLPAEGKRNARIALLQKATEKAGGLEDLSADKFKNEINRLSKSTGIFFSGADKKALDGLVNALKLTERGAQAGVLPRTGEQAVGVATIGFIPYLLGAGEPGAAAATATLASLGRVYESKPVRNALINLADAKPGMETELLRQLTAAIQGARQFEEE